MALSHFSEEDPGPLCTPGTPVGGGLQRGMPTCPLPSPTPPHRHSWEFVGNSYAAMHWESCISWSSGFPGYREKMFHPSATLRDFTLALAQLQGMVCCYSLPCFPTELCRRRDTRTITLPFAGVQFYIIITFYLPYWVTMLCFALWYHFLFHSNKI